MAAPMSDPKAAWCAVLTSIFELTELSMTAHYRLKKLIQDDSIHAHCWIVEIFNVYRLLKLRSHMDSYQGTYKYLDVIGIVGNSTGSPNVVQSQSSETFTTNLV